MRKNIIASLALSLGLTAFVIPKSSIACSSEPLLGSICMMGTSFCPRGYIEADGQLLAINQNQALFSLFGTMYGGDGRTTFGIPALRGRVPIHEGNGPGLSNYPQGAKSGVESVTLNSTQIPSHNHSATLHAATAGGNTEIPANNTLANSRRTSVYSSTPGAQTNLSSSSITVGQAGGNQSHENRQPYLAIKFCVATIGVFPSRN